MVGEVSPKRFLQGSRWQEPEWKGRLLGMQRSQIWEKYTVDGIKHTELGA